MLRYQKDIVELKDVDSDMKILFQENIKQSNWFMSELTQLMIEPIKEVETGTIDAGKAYRVRKDVKAFLGESDRIVILHNCEKDEDVTLTAYKDAWYIH